MPKANGSSTTYSVSYKVSEWYMKTWEREREAIFSSEHFWENLEEVFMQLLSLQDPNLRKLKLGSLGDNSSNESDLKIPSQLTLWLQGPLQEPHSLGSEWTLLVLPFLGFWVCMMIWFACCCFFFFFCRLGCRWATCKVLVATIKQSSPAC